MVKMQICKMHIMTANERDFSFFSFTVQIPVNKSTSICKVSPEDKLRVLKLFSLFPFRPNKNSMTIRDITKLSL